MSGEFYRIKAAELQAQAADERWSAFCGELQHLATLYLKLAEQADKNELIVDPQLEEQQLQVNSKIKDIRVICLDSTQEDGWGIRIEYADGGAHDEFIGSKADATAAMGGAPLSG